MAARTAVQSAEILRLAGSDLPPGQRLGLIRGKLGLTQEELGASIGVSGVSVTKWENEQTVPSDRMKARLATKTRIPPEAWVTWAAERQEEGEGEAA